MTNTATTKDFNAPITNEELAALYMADQYDKRETAADNALIIKDAIGKIADALMESSRASKSRYDTILFKITEQNSLLTKQNNALTTALNQMTTELKELSASINSSIKSIRSMKDVDATKYAAEDITTVKTPRMNSFKFSTRMTYSDRSSWRTAMVNEVLSYARQNHITQEQVFIKIYNKMSDYGNYTIPGLYGIYKKELKAISKIDMISMSDYLVNHFNKAWGEIKKTSMCKPYSSADVVVCPEQIKGLAKKLSATKSADGISLSALYSLYNTTDSIDEAVKYVKSKYGFKNVNRGFAIMAYPGAYEKLEKLVNNLINN